MKVTKTILAAVAGLTLLGGVAGMACGGSSSAAGAGPEGSGDAQLVSVTDTATHLSFHYPSTWTRTGESPLTYSGQDEFVSEEARPVPAGDVLAAAKADEAAVKAANPGYKSIATIAASTEVKNAAVVSYEWDLAKSAVTGKPVHQRADRYYINLGNGQMAILTGSSPSTRFDREQVRDIALTVQAAK
ncbi:MAG: hypothetical protein ABI305_02090 [Tepidiformaceae bacterium]